MSENQVYRSAQLNQQITPQKGIKAQQFTAKTTGITGGWLYIGLARKLVNYDVSCFYDIDYSFGFGLSCGEIVVEKFKDQARYKRSIKNEATISLNVNFHIGKIWIAADGVDLDISISDPKLKEGGEWYPTFLLHKKDQSFEILNNPVPVQPKIVQVLQPIKKEVKCEKGHVMRHINVNVDHPYKNSSAICNDCGKGIKYPCWHYNCLPCRDDYCMICGVAHETLPVINEPIAETEIKSKYDRMELDKSQQDEIITENEFRGQVDDIKALLSKIKEIDLSKDDKV